MSQVFAKIIPANLSPKLDSYDAYIIACCLTTDTKSWADLCPAQISKVDRELIEKIAQRDPKKIEAGHIVSFDRWPLQRWNCVILEAEQDMFQLLSLARQVLKPLKNHGCKRVLVDLRSLPANISQKFSAALVATAKALEFNFPKYGKSEAKPLATPMQMDLCLSETIDIAGAERILEHAAASGDVNNQIRQLVMQAGNDLTPYAYVQRLKTLAEQNSLTYTFISQKELQTMGAGAFLAVTKGSAHEDAGIVKLNYVNPSRPQGRHLILVGKGVTFDTGGHNLKSPAGMYGMHRDMAGSALAYGLLALAAQEKWPIQVTAYLAIADNAIGPEAYRQNDVVTALNGKTIEIIDTDAEGRMLLADTLHLACLEKPDLLFDFATLTGACIRAISTTYSGVFTNRREWHQALIKAGQESGERVWPFPMDADFGEALKSDVADIKQCRVKGGVDHIEAAIFLKEFVSNDVPWIHVDLAAAENSGGLGHIDTEVTGFGIRFVSEFLKDHWGFQ